MERLGLEKLVEESIAQWYCSEGTPGRSQLWMGLLGCTEVRGDSQGEADVTHSASLEDYSLLSTCSIWELGVRYWWVIAKAVCPQVSRRIWVSNSALVFHKHTRTRLLIRSGFGSDTLLLHLPSPETCLVPRGPWLWPLDLGGDDRLKRGPPQVKGDLRMFQKGACHQTCTSISETNRDASHRGYIPENRQKGENIKLMC